MSQFIINIQNTTTVDPVYSERVSPHRSLIYSQIKYVYSEYTALVKTFCCTDPFTINGIDCNKLWFKIFFRKKVFYKLIIRVWKSEATLISLSIIESKYKLRAVFCLMTSLLTQFFTHSKWS
jgi:hypothetical protein